MTVFLRTVGVFKLGIFSSQLSWGVNLLYTQHIYHTHRESDLDEKKKVKDMLFKRDWENRVYYSVHPIVIEEHTVNMENSNKVSFMTYEKKIACKFQSTLNYSWDTWSLRT